MDNSTLSAYDRNAKAFADDWESQPMPSDLQAIVREYFTGGPTADIGCGSGRDAAWLNAHGYPTQGFDASESLLIEARKRHPSINFVSATLPDLDVIADCSFTNVFCETVIMHLDASEITRGVERLLAILAPGGTLYLSWRVTKDHDGRDKFGRLYAAVRPQQVLDALSTAQILYDDQTESVSSTKLVRRIVARKSR